MDELAPFVLKNVLGLDEGEKKGSGAYGAVYKVTVNGTPCIAKRLHDVLVDPQVPPKEKASIQQKFRQECIILSKLRHPHIVHFVGVHYAENLSLIMEWLHTDLANFLEDNFERRITIPLSVKLSVLLDVSYGLLYLHTHTPTIIHRDLTAPNILVTKDARAKIADLGVSKLLDPHTQAAKMYTRVPGTHFYMPPEALKANPVYDFRLDVFSFGHLTLYTVNQEFPQVHEITDYHPGIMQIWKRREAFDKMGDKHCLYPLATHCLQDKPECRPITSELNERLKQLCTKYPTDVPQITGSEKDEMVRLTEELQTLQLRNQTMEDSMQKLQQHSREQSQECLKLRQLLTASQEETGKGLEEVDTHNLKDIKGLEGTTDLDRMVARQQSEIEKLQQEKVELQNELQLVRVEAQLYREDFASERHDREQAHGKIADLEGQLGTAVEAVRAELAQSQYNLQVHKDRLAEVELLFQKREGEIKSLTMEVTDKQTEVQAKTSQVKQYKKQVDTLKDQVAEHEKHNKELTQEMQRLRRELEKVVGELEKSKRNLKKGKKTIVKGSHNEMDSPTELDGLQLRLAQCEQLYKEMKNENHVLRDELRKANIPVKEMRPKPQPSLILARPQPSEKQLQDTQEYMQHLPWLSGRQRNNGHVPLSKVQSAAAVMSSDRNPPPIPPRVIEGTQPLPMEQDELDGTYVSYSEIHAPPQKKNGGPHSALNRRSYPSRAEAPRSQPRSSEYLQVLPMLQEQQSDADVPTAELQSPPARNSQDDSP